MAIHWPGNTRNWAPEVRKVVRELERLYDVHCYTYPNHGRPGERWSIDIPVAPLGQSANAKQRALDERVMKRAALARLGHRLHHLAEPDEGGQGQQLVQLRAFRLQVSLWLARSRDKAAQGPRTPLLHPRLHLPSPKQIKALCHG
jgi:hypothetical protein